MATALSRVIAVWVPDWPIHAFLAEMTALQHIETVHPAAGATSDSPLTPDSPLALLSRQRVVACSPAARAAGVRRGQREREAQSFCPELDTHAHEPEIDERHFLRVLDALEEIIPGVEPLRPGLSAMRARGPARYFGDETLAANAILECMTTLGYHEARVGIACGKFAATEAARASVGAPGITAPRERIHVVPEHDTVPFLGTLPVARACDSELARTLEGLGIHTLAHLSALPAEAVRERFGLQGMAAYRHATAQPAPNTLTADEVTPRIPPVDLVRSIDLEPPVDGTEHLAFACSTLADELMQAMQREALVCTELRIELTDDVGVRHERSWSHPRQFTSADVLGRLRWQSAALTRDAGRGGAGVVRVRFTPLRTDRAASHEPGLWSSEPDARVHHHLQRVQSILGYEAVVTAELTGGRLSHERFRFIPWGTRPAPSTRVRHRPNLREGPWPGHLKDPLPSTVFPTPLAASLLDAAGEPVRIDAADLLTASPAMLSVAEAAVRSRVAGWSAPWPLREQWWRARPTRFRMQVVAGAGDAWLLLHEHDTWFVEGRYD